MAVSTTWGPSCALYGSPDSPVSPDLKGCCLSSFGASLATGLAACQLWPFASKVFRFELPLPLGQVTA